MNPSDKITFDIVSIYAGNSPRALELLTSTNQGKITWIDNYGSINYRALQKGESPHVYNIDAQESYIHNGEKAIRVFKTISYWPSELEGQLDPESRTANIIARHAHELVKTHQNVIVRGENGGNINPNQSGMSLFELRETTKITNEKVEKNKKIAEAMFIASDYFTESKKQFLKLCYRYSILPVEGVPVEKLFNEMVIKINNNPDSFFLALNHKTPELLELVRKASFYSEETPAIITYEEPFYSMNGVVVGQTEEEVLYNIEKDPKLKEFLYKSMGADLKEQGIVVTELPKESDAIVSTTASQNYQRRTDEARIDEAKKALNYIFNQWKTSLQKSPEKKAELEQKFEAKLLEKRAAFIDLADYYDAEVANRRKYV